MPAGPCILCGTTDYPLSMGGPTICPACDCGSFPDPALATKRMLGLKPPPAFDERAAGMMSVLGEQLALATCLDCAVLQANTSPERLLLGLVLLCPRHDPNVVTMRALRPIEAGQLVTLDDVEPIKG